MNNLFILILFVIVFMFLELKNVLTKSVLLFFLLVLTIYVLEYNKDRFTLNVNTCDFIPYGKNTFSM